MLDEGLVQAYVFYLVFDQGGGIGVAYNNYMNPYGYNNMYSNPQMPVNNLQMPMSNVVQQPVIQTAVKPLALARGYKSVPWDTRKSTLGENV